MTFLAFDPDQLQALTWRARLVLVELASLPTGDPAADDTDRSVRRVMHTIELGLLPAVRRVLEARPLRAPIDARADLDALPNALARELAVTRGWAVQLDPMVDDPARTTAEEVDALARRLSAMDPATVLEDGETTAWLAEELHAIAADPLLSRRFDETFGQWRAWAEVLAVHRTALAVDPGAATSDALGRLDRLVDGFGRVASRTVDVGDHDEQPLAWLGSVTPYAAAMFLDGLDLPAATIASVAIRVLRRTPDPMDGRGPTAADLVLQAVLRHDAALPTFAATAVTQTDVLAQPLHDPMLLAEVLVQATDPARATAADAGQVLVPVLRAALAGEAPQLRDTTLADLVAPWTAHFLATNHEWGLGAVERSAMLRGAVQSTAAVTRLLDRSDVVMAGARRALVDDPARSIVEFDNYLGAMGAILMNEHVHRTVLRARAWDTICALAGLATAFVPWAAVGLAASAAVVVVHNQRVPDIGQAQKDSLFMADAALTQAGATVVATMFEGYRSIGRIPATFTPPPAANPNSGDATSADYLWRFLDWEATLPGGSGGAIATDIRSGLFGVIGPSQVGEHVWWIANGFPGT